MATEQLTKKAPAKKTPAEKSPKEKSPKGKSSIPDFLVKETIDGIPFYYAGFRDVLNKTKKPNDIMADSGLQLVLKNFIKKLLDKYLAENLY